MNASLKRWITTTAERNELINTLTANLTMLRARLSVSQEDIAKFVGISRQTYSAVERGKRPMSWPLYLALILFFDENEATHNLLSHLNCYPYSLK